MDNKYLELSEVLTALDQECISHHGIKGQKWGIEHGPPYPLKEGVSARIKRAAKSVKNRVEENRKERESKKTDRAERSAKKKETLQDRINKMSDAELIERTNRLRLENAYKRELPQEKEGEGFLKKSASLMNDLKTAGEAFAGLVRTGKTIGKLFGLGDDGSSDYDWTKRRPGETPKQYSDRLNALKNIRNKTKEFKEEDDKARAAAEAKAKEEQEQARARRNQRTEAAKNAAYNTAQAAKEAAQRAKARWDSARPSGDTRLMTQEQAEQERWDEFARRTGFNRRR